MAQNIKFPKTNVPILSASSPIENSEQKVLFVGESSSAAVADVLYENIPNSSTEIEALFGKGSVLSQMLISAREINPVVQFDAITPVNNGSAVAATATITITGTDADAAGSVDIVLGSKRNGSFSVPYALADTPTAVATLISDYINLAANKIGPDLGFSAASALGVVTITATTDGVLFDEVSLSASLSDADLGVTVGGFLTTSTGVGDPDTSSTLDVIGEERYQTIVWPYRGTAVADLVPVIDARFNATNDVQDGVAIIGQAGLFATVLADANDNYNSQSIVYIAQLMETLTAEESTGIVELPWVIAAQFAAIRSLRRQPDANISAFVIANNGALDSIGGPALSSKPYANTPMALLSTIPVGKGFISTEIDQLNDAGATVLGNNKSRSSVIMGQVVTTYKTDSAGDPDDSFKFLNYVDTASTAREYFFNNLASRYAQTRLTDGNLIKGRDMTNVENIRAVMTGFYQTLSDVDYVVARKGEDVLQFFKENMSVTIDLLTGTANIVFSLPIVTQLREINAPMQLTFNIE